MHEMTRKDRDSFVQILTDNIEPDERHNFTKVSSPFALDLGRYDFGSIMHYGLYSFSANGGLTIQPIVDIPDGVRVGVGSTLSAGDINGIKAMYALHADPSELVVYKEGGSFPIDIRTLAGRSWGVSETSPWLSANRSSGRGNGQVLVRVEPNTGTRARTANLNLSPTSSQIVSVNIRQAAGDCSYAVSRTSLTAPGAGGALTVRVTTPSHCDWTVQEQLAWARLSVIYADKGTGNVTIHVSRNFGAARRTGTVTIAGQTVRIGQPGGFLPPTQ
jgi:hypothetical protein